MVLDLVKSDFILHEMAQQERKQFFVVACLSEVFTEALYSYVNI